VSFYGLAVAALASLGAVVSGIALTGGDLWGRGLAFADHVHGRSPDCCSVPNRENLVILPRTTQNSLTTWIPLLKAEVPRLA